MTATPTHDRGPGHQQRLIAAAWQQAKHVRSASRATPAPPTPVTPPDVIPGYRILREIQRGGQGVVYQAVQESTKRIVALKVLRDGPFAAASQRLRFEREVQTLARLRHPNIVTIHDRGTAGEAAYFVMDYIAGHPLDEYARLRSLGLRERLRLMATICAAVNVAHLHGVIHRDLKPGNVRVDDSGEPHVLDFGLAKDADAAETPAMTVAGQFVGSLPWASPEQAQGRQDEVDLRTDVYSLGVMLYQLVTGQFPYDVSGPLSQVARNIVECTPANPRTLNAHVDHELATIVLKALRKERELRYQTAGALGADLQRYLNGEPIEAKRDSLSYLVRKQLVRHRGAAGAAAGFLVLIVASSFVFLALWQRAATARDAERQAALVSRHNEKRAQAEVAKATAVNAFLQEMLTAADPTGAQGPQVTVREVLDAAAAKIDNGPLRDQPLAEAAARSAMGLTYLRLGLLDEAETQLTSALTLNRRELGTQHPDVATDLNNLGMLAHARGNPTLAESYYREALQTFETQANPSPDALSGQLANLGLIVYELGRLDEAQKLFERARAIEEQAGNVSDRKRATTLNNLALVVRDRGDLERAESLFRESLALLRKTYGNDHPHVAAVLESLGSIAQARGDYDAAEPLYREALAIRRRVLGDRHPDVALSLSNLGFFLYTKGDYDGAEPLYREALALRREVLGPDHPKVGVVLNNLGLLLAARGDYDAAEPLYREALRIKLASYGEGHPSTLLQMYNLAALLQQMDCTEEAEELLRQAAEIAAKSLPAGHPYIASLRGEWGVTLAALGRYEEAEQALLSSYELCVQQGDAGRERAAAIAEKLNTLYDEWPSPGRVSDTSVPSTP